MTLSYSQMSDKDTQAWTAWKSQPNDENYNILLKRFEAIINKEVQKWRGGTMPLSLMRIEGFKIVGEAVKSYDPKLKVKLSTYITSQLQKLKRYGYKNQNVLYIPESRVIKVRSYKDAQMHLTETLGRAPSSRETADYLRWSLAEVTRLESELRSDLLAEHQFDAGVKSEVTPMDFKLNYVYNDLNPKQQVVFENTLGLNGKTQKNTEAIAALLKTSPSEVFRLKEQIAKKIRELRHG